MRLQGGDSDLKARSQPLADETGKERLTGAVHATRMS